MVTPIMLQILPIINSPRISPKKNGIAFRCVFNPPCFKMTHLITELKNIENQKTFIDQLLETAYPAGWNGHQKNLTLINISRSVVTNPTLVATIEA